jgi:lipoprotein-releasing system permease protein
LNTGYFIAHRILTRDKANFSRPIVRISVLSIAIGITVMFVAIAILTGFQKQIREKVSGFGAHIQILHYDENASMEPKPISRHQEFLPYLRRIKEIRHIQVFATKAGIIKTKDQIQGIILKGIGTDYDPTFFSDKIIQGRMIRISDTGKTNEIMISKNLSDLLQIRLNDDVRMYFISGTNMLGRKFKVAGIYETGLEEFDKIYVLCDIRHIQHLNNWNPDEIGGFEITLNDFNSMDRIGDYIYKRIGFSLDAKTIRQLYPQIFDWLDLQDINVLIILILMILVAGITMISTLLILILDRTNMIGILKALGMTNTGVRRIFLMKATYIIGQGLLLGNAIGLAICLVQQKFGIIRLPQESYYVSVVPIHLDILNILLLNGCTMVICFMMLIVPSFVIARITPVRAIRFA